MQIQFVFNPEVINNLDSDNKFAKSELSVAAHSNAYLGRNCHPRDGFPSLQGECN